ncbi:MAG: mannose-6-phosphate isomerase, class I [Sphingobacteriales bacterium]|nr:mannose-6-phosphate isomerase, class I [Sphingobacteriales bacterium]OJY84284.1 MAG: mannose-6-phosphate isomerase, class I [Sphingobacteriales bacterium 44-15]
MYKLTGKAQHYTWGGTTYIPELLGIDNPEQKPFAEYWMGAHPSNPSLIEQDEQTTISLGELIHQNPSRYLGEKVTKQFGGLPFLFKVLDVKEMLSIQVHPTKEEAIKGFARENEAGIPLSASHRNYKDDNHKPEVMVALSEFWLLHGFKERALLMETLQQIPELNILIPIFEKGGYYGLYKYVMELPQERVDEMLSPLLKKIMPEYTANKLTRANAGYWACKAIASNSDKYHNIDRGIFSVYFFNIVQLHPGQAIFQGAGIPHAYLEGQNIELMSNSDNVLRGGLTPKHIDVPELLNHTLFEGITPHILNGETRGAETIYHCPVPDFVVSKIGLAKNETFTHDASSAEILIVTEGEVICLSNGKELMLEKGEAAFAGAGEQYTVTSPSRAVLFKAAVPGK